MRTTNSLKTTKTGDDIFVFGFSRGAFASRSLCGYVSRCGVIQPGSPLGVKQLYDRYKKGNHAKTLNELLEPGAERSGYGLEERWMIRDCAPAPIKFAGVWDTVGSVATTAHHALLTGGDHSFLDTNLRKNEEHVYHAIAIGENRAAFDVTLLSYYRPNTETTPYVSPRPLADVEQSWFCGAHGDVGGGTYSDALAQLPLRWLLTKASSYGLAFKRDVELDAEASTAGEILRHGFSPLSTRPTYGLLMPSRSASLFRPPTFSLSRRNSFRALSIAAATGSASRRKASAARNSFIRKRRRSVCLLSGRQACGEKPSLHRATCGH